MRIFTFGLILLSVALSSGSQLALKAGMTSPSVQQALEGGGPLRVAFGLLASPLVMGGLFCFGLSALVWLFVLSRVPLSTAYPFVALGIAVTVLGGRFLFHEALTPLKLVGVFLIMAGIVAISYQGFDQA